MFTNAELMRIMRNEKPKRKKSATKNRPEADYTNQIIKELLLDGWLVVRVNSGMVKTENGFPFFAYTIANNASHSGFPDLIAFKGSEYRLIEVKAKGGRLSDNQKRFGEMASKHNVEVEVMKA